MKSEVIIAARGEVPYNLVRTVTQALEQCAVCVVFDGNERGNETPADLPPQTRVERPFEYPVGPGKCRDYGITTSSADVVIICDGHMSFDDGTLDRIFRYHQRHKNHLTCCRMRSLSQDWQWLDDTIYGGADLILKTLESGGLHYAISAKWRGGNMVRGEVPAVMGACYGMRRAWYQRIGYPLSVLDAWGQDEEILSLSTHIMGGKVVLLPYVCGHIYAAHSVGRNRTADEGDRMWRNRMATVMAIPMPDEERADLFAWMRKTRVIGAFPRLQQTEQLEVLCSALYNRGKVSWEQLKSRGIVRYATEDEQARYLGFRRPSAPAKHDARPIVPQQAIVQPAPQAYAPSSACTLCRCTNVRRVVDKRLRMSFLQCPACGHKSRHSSL